nr:ornithine carbamoyltransferase, mitochondrial-like [Onthophagus taurus]
MIWKFQKCFISSWISTRKLEHDDLNYILSISQELKKSPKKQRKHFSDFKGAKNAKIALILQQPNVYVQTPAILGSKLLDVKLNTIIDQHWDEQENVQDLPSNFSVPLICIQSSYYKLLKCLADFMAISNHFNGLKGVKLCWIGPPTALFNTYMLLGPKLGMDISFFCGFCKDSPLTPAVFKDAKEICATTNTAMKQCNSLEEAIKDANVVVTTCNIEPDLKLSLKAITNGCNKNWHVLTDLPRCTNEMDEEVFVHRNCLVWEAMDNMKWVFSAFSINGILEKNKNK